ncbi:MAG: HD domain-containing protein [Syntrophorhabdales bacterium]
MFAYLSCQQTGADKPARPSTAPGPGPRRNLREHKRFLEILQDVSLYDHTYNVLKAALDIGHDELQHRHDFLLPGIIAAALGHDIGKVASPWRSSPARKRTHESVAETRLERMLSSHGNEVFTKTVVTAVSLHHTGPKDETVGRGSL